MSAREKYGTRDLAYSAWHRASSIGRFIDRRSAKYLSMIDIDVVLFCEYDDKTRDPLVLIETSRYVEGQSKTSKVTEKLARKANIPALNVMYELSEKTNPQAPNERDISWFHVRRIHPRQREHFVRFSPADYASELMKLRAWQLARRARH